MVGSIEQSQIKTQKVPNEKIFCPEHISTIRHIPHEDILKELQLGGNGIPKSVVSSVLQKEWFSIDGGKVIMEINNPDIVNKKRKGDLYISDFDDTLVRTSQWHSKEQELMEQAHPLDQFYKKITMEKAKKLYELSKIKTPKVSNLKRYTPCLNIALLSAYQKKLYEFDDEEKAFEYVSELADTISRSTTIEDDIAKLPLDSELVSLLSNNNIGDFMYTDFMKDLIEGTDPEDVRIIASRGTIEGPLGQIQKVHQSGILTKTNDSNAESPNLAIDIVFYFNDSKQEVLTIWEKLFPQGPKHVIIYDDNPDELKAFYGSCSNSKLDVELIEVKHPGAKRKDITASIDPVDILESTEPDQPRYLHYLPNPNTSSVQVK